MPQLIQLGSPAIRIYQGETISGQGWANAAFQLTGQFRIHYDDGSEDLFVIDRTALGATRSRTGLPSRRVAKTDGWVNSGSVWQVPGATNSSAAQRGACYVQIGILAGAPGDSTGIFPEIRVQLARGYCYLGHPVMLGENVEPGPTGGSGSMREISVASVAGGGSAGIALTAVPTNAMWRIISGKAIYTASATVGNRNYGLRFRDNAANVFMDSPLTGAVAATQKGEIEFAQNLSTEQSVGLPNQNASVETPAPLMALPAAYDLFVNDNNNVDAADTVTLEMQVEEWVIPGL